jgi:hypothetical protein
VSDHEASADVATCMDEVLTPLESSDGLKLVYRRADAEQIARLLYALCFTIIRALVTYRGDPHSRSNPISM